MPRVPLLGGAYSARSVIANAQRCINLFPEKTPAESQPPTPVTHYLTPGLVTLVTPKVGAVRCLYRATTGSLYACVGNTVYFINSSLTVVNMGTIAAGTTPVSMSDNGIVGVLVDGSGTAYKWTLGVNTLSAIVDAAVYGADRVCFLDGFFIFNRPNTNQFYLSPAFWNGATAFDPTYIASKTGGADKIISIAVINGNLWLLGQLNAEVWFNAGGTDFPFQRQPGVFVEHGMLLGWSVVEADVEIFFLGRDRQGQAVVFMGRDYTATRISTHALEAEIQGYSAVNDAVGMAYQEDGHTFYVIAFPTADKTWAFDLSTGQWHERQYGSGHRHRANCCANVFNMIVCGDYSTGAIYNWSLAAYDDFGQAIVRKRGFPHLVKDGKRLSYNKFQLDMEVGGGGPASANVTVRWSDTRGASWGTDVTISLDFGLTGEYYQSPTLQRLGMARDRVFEVEWSFPYKTALNGAWIEVEPAET